MWHSAQQTVSSSLRQNWLAISLQRLEPRMRKQSGSKRGREKEAPQIKNDAKQQLLLSCLQTRMCFEDWTLRTSSYWYSCDPRSVEIDGSVHHHTTPGMNQPMGWLAIHTYTHSLKDTQTYNKTETQTYTHTTTETAQNWETVKHTTIAHVMWECEMSKVNSRTSCQWLDAVTRSLPINIASKGCRSLGWIILNSLCCVKPDWYTVRPFSAPSAVSYSLSMKLTACLGGKLQQVTWSQSLIIVCAWVRVCAYSKMLTISYVKL